jgi:hypothetical protein
VSKCTKAARDIAGLFPLTLHVVLRGKSVVPNPSVRPFRSCNAVHNSVDLGRQKPTNATNPQDIADRLSQLLRDARAEVAFSGDPAIMFSPLPPVCVEDNSSLIPGTFDEIAQSAPRLD